LSSSVRRRLPTLALCLSLVLAAYLRLAHVTDNPGWFSDEGTHLNIAANLLRGRVQYLAVRDSTLLAARLPLFDGLLAGLLALAGAGPGADSLRGLSGLRGFTASLGVLTTLLLCLAAWRMGGRRGRWLGVLAALTYALYPQAIVYSRFGFSYNLVAPLLLAALWAVWEFQRAAAQGAPAGRWLALAALAGGLAALSDLWGLVLLAPLTLAALTARRVEGRALAGLGLALLPLGLYAASMLLRAPRAFVFDLSFTLFRLGATPLPAQAALLAGNLLTLFSQEGWMALGAVGLFALRPARLRRLALLFFWAPLLLVGRSASLSSLSFYYLIPLLPLAALGLGALTLNGAHALARLVARALRPVVGRRAAAGGSVAAALAVAVAALYLAAQLAAQARAGFATAIDPFLLNPADARQAAAYVNARAAPGEVVLASPALAWLIDANAADFQMALARAGTATPHLPAGLPAERFAFDPRLDRARFVVVDNLWRNWGVYNVAGLPEMLAEVEGWRAVFTAGEVVVWERNP
jgi:4-amino-4-deoxy-L-arabinose transferase-like glycosyltransferase